MLCQLSYSGKYSYIIFTGPHVVNTFFKLFVKNFPEVEIQKRPVWRRAWQDASVFFRKGYVAVVRWLGYLFIFSRQKTPTS